MTSPEQDRNYALAVRFHNRAVGHHSEGEPVRPERLYLQAIRIKEEIFGPEHQEVAITIGNLGLFYKVHWQIGRRGGCTSGRSPSFNAISAHPMTAPARCCSTCRNF